MEMEYKDTNRRGKFVIIIGVVLAVAAGAASFYLINQAQQSAGQGELSSPHQPAFADPGGSWSADVRFDGDRGGARSRRTAPRGGRA